MKTLPLLMNEPPVLSDEAAVQLLDFLHELLTACENHYAAQLFRHHQAQQQEDRPQMDLLAEPFQAFDADAPF